MNISEIHAFILAGHKATGTLVNNDTGNRFTFRFRRPTEGKADCVFVDLLTGPDNEHDYSYAGMLFDNSPGKLRMTKGSKVSDDAMSVRALNYLLSHCVRGVELREGVEFLHSGRCGKCGRKLTTDTSIKTGLGPVCAGRV